MFIKKDLRKIEQIFTDETDSRESLKLSKRPSEFQGKIGLYFMYSIIYLTSAHSYMRIFLYDYYEFSILIVDYLNLNYDRYSLQRVQATGTE
jgi:hypothetical protein